MYVYGIDGNQLGYMPDTLASAINNGYTSASFAFDAADLWCFKFS